MINNSCVAAQKRYCIVKPGYNFTSRLDFKGKTYTSMANSDFVIVCAIDFGTTYSGYAFSFKTNPDDVIVNKDWAGAMGFQVQVIVLV